MIDWLRIGIFAAIAVAITAAGVALRSHWIGTGEARVQAKWDAQNKADADLALQLAQERAREQVNVFRNAERTADESDRREKARAGRLAVAERTVRELLDAIASLDADDLSAAAADPRLAPLAERARAGRELLGRCAARYEDLAGRADRLRDQVAGLQDFALNVCHAGDQAHPQEAH